MSDAHERGSTDAERSALAATWAEFEAALRSFFTHRVAADDVDDLLQECFLRIARSLPDLRDEERIGGWVFAVARNLVTDHGRRRRRTEDPAPSEEPSAADSESDLGVRVGGWLAAMVERLPDDYADVLRDSELRGLRHRDIAERLGLSVSAIKSRVQRGRTMLRERLLACCELEFDRRGGIRDFERRSTGRCDC